MFAKCLVGFVVLLSPQTLFAFQDSTITQLHWRNQPMSIEDNSFLLEEAFNQSPGIIQYTASAKFHHGTAALNFEFELPIRGESHQLSFSIPAKVFQSNTGMEDLVFSYRPLLSGRQRWLMLTPKISVILPTGNFAHGLGNGTFGLEWNIAMTKRISRKLISHINAGSSYSLCDTQLEILEKRLQSRFAGMSVIFAVARRFDLLAEVIAADEVSAPVKSHLSLIGNPGFRLLLNINGFAVVPGMSTPIEILSGRPRLSQVLFYLSIERAQ